MTCQTCQRQTTAVTIGTAQYCVLCGSRTESAAEVTTVAPPARRSLDLKRGNAPVVSARGTSARKLHQATSPAKSRTLDLRAPKPVVRRGTVNIPAATTSPKPVMAPVVTAPALAPKPTLAAPEAPTPAPVHKHHDAAKIAARLERAKQIERSGQVSKFGTSALTATKVEPAIPKVVAAPVLPAAAAAAHQNLRKFVAPAPVKKAATRRSKLSQYAAAGAAVAVMAGYIWVQNYPNLTIQAAANQAGVAATKPSYLPTSYSLAGTSARAGLLTLNFKSPSQSTPLTIAQAPTSWDTQTLADSFVAKTDSNYSSVTGQGLTIYLYGQNQAAWVNHGIWYTIKGTARLSRDEILKIAYGL